MNLKVNEPKNKNKCVGLKAKVFSEAEDDDDMSEQIANLAENFSRFMKKVN